MTINDFLQAVVVQLTALWPERPIHTDVLSQEADGGFFVGLAESEQSAGLGRRGRRMLRFEVLYAPREGDELTYGAWLDEMYGAFSRLEVSDAAGGVRSIRLTNVCSRKDSKESFCRFLFDAEFYFVLAPQDEPLMEVLEQKEVLR